jgi:hypothetical protein
VDKYSVVKTVKTVPEAKTMAFDSKTHQLFLSTAENGQFEILVVGKWKARRGRRLSGIEKSGSGIRDEP